MATEGEAKLPPNPEAVQKLARATGASLFDAFTAAGYFDDATEEEREALETAIALLELPENLRRAVRSLIKDLRQ